MVQRTDTTPTTSPPPRTQFEHDAGRGGLDICVHNAATKKTATFTSATMDSPSFDSAVSAISPAGTDPNATPAKVKEFVNQTSVLALIKSALESTDVDGWEYDRRTLFPRKDKAVFELQSDKKSLYVTLKLAIGILKMTDPTNHESAAQVGTLRATGLYRLADSEFARESETTTYEASETATHNKQTSTQAKRTGILAWILSLLASIFSSRR